ncbi:MAG: hypothetical protein EOO92_01435 [Pedobacter sp.]|nr:MAG: hypothetical protein EOO92_01435 [Pedobacter sp.]
MASTTLKELTNEKLLKQKDLLKGISIGFAVVYLVVIGILIYLFATKGFKNISVALIPVFTFPITLLPLLINLSSVNKEIKLRNL